MVVRASGIAGPHDAYIVAGCRCEPLPPTARRVGLGMQVGDRGRDRRQRRAECERQARQRTVAVERRDRVALRAQDRDAVEMREQRREWALHREDDARAAPGDVGHIAAELQGVTQALLAVQQDGLAGYVEV